MTKQRARAITSATSKPESHRYYEFGTFEDRLEHFCALIEIDKPDWPYTDGKPAITGKIMGWVKRHNVQIDWLLAGSPSSMLKAHAEKGAAADTLLKLGPDMQAVILATLRAVMNKEISAETAIADFSKAVTDLRHEDLPRAVENYFT